MVATSSGQPSCDGHRAAVRAGAGGVDGLEGETDGLGPQNSVVPTRESLESSLETDRLE